MHKSDRGRYNKLRPCGTFGVDEFLIEGGTFWKGYVRKNNSSASACGGSYPSSIHQRLPISSRSDDSVMSFHYDYYY